MTGSGRVFGWICSRTYERRQYARRLRLNTDQQNEIAEAKLLTAHKGGELLCDRRDAHM